MASRLDLQSTLEALLGLKNVYYQPPASVKMGYPAIVYSRNNINNRHADNSVYSTMTSYEIMVIDRNPDSSIVAKVSVLPGIRFNRHYVTENLYHDVFTLYY